MRASLPTAWRTFAIYDEVNSANGLNDFASLGQFFLRANSSAQLKPLVGGTERWLEVGSCPPRPTSSPSLCLSDSLLSFSQSARVRANIPGVSRLDGRLFG